MPNMNDRRAARIRTLLNLMTFLTNHRDVPVGTVCDIFGLTRRELVSAVNEILMCGLPPYGPSDYVTAWIENGRVALVNADFLQRPLCLTLGEAVSIKVMVEDFMRQSPGVFQEAAETLSGKIDVILGRRTAAPAPESAHALKMSALEQALSERRAVALEYYSRPRDEIIERIVEPLAIVDIDGLWYLIAFCRLRRAERSFRVDRIRNARLLEERFMPKSDLDIDRFRRREMFFPAGDETKVRVRFSGDGARYARERFAERVSGEEADGAVTCEFPAADSAWITDLVVDFAPDAEILDPAAVRRDFRRRLKTVLDAYRDDEAQ